MEQAELEDALEFCVRTVEAGAEIGANELHVGEAVTIKADGTPQTPTDVMIDNFLADAIARRGKDELYIGEERVGNLRAWVADSWDGSWLRAKGAAMGVVSMALVVAGKPLVGVVCNPFTHETFSAMEGGSAYLNGGRITVNDATTISGSIFTLPGSRVASVSAGGLFNELIVEGGGDMLNTGSAIYDLLQTVMGVAAAGIYPYSSPWDGAAIDIIGRCAGAKITGLHGGKLSYGGDIDGLLITNGHMHKTMLDVVNRHLVRP
ncbi:MAG TPA: inositol monophosphatase family protein [Magnetospirillaceae bacterium]|nr:inositol monophosphatase family protein [Magnetospirillaceae bacterium]